MTDSMDQSPSWEASSYLASQILHILWNGRILTIFTRAHHWSVSWTWWLQFPSYISRICFNITLSSTSGSSKRCLPFRFSTIVLYAFLPSYAYNMSCPCNPLWYDHPNNIWWRVHIRNNASSSSVALLSLNSPFN